MMSIFEEIDRIFDSANGEPYYHPRIPTGYELVEKPEHKKQRLEQAINSNRNMLHYHEQQIKQLQDKISEQENDLLKLNP